ncbi:hypothetical protein VKT23_018582 [Stygiomarasmius scandens]|uniref:Protein kinase domain-containing protein n=1 Tax=Marasmiellus scandens TaxID=2682957 RepID=A0ABR1IT63_9AGAR
MSARELRCYYYTETETAKISIDDRAFLLKTELDAKTSDVLDNVSECISTKKIKGPFQMFCPNQFPTAPEEDVDQRAKEWLKEHLNERIKVVYKPAVKDVWPAAEGYEHYFDIIAVDSDTLNSLRLSIQVGDPQLELRVPTIRKHEQQLEAMDELLSPSQACLKPSTVWEGEKVKICGGRPFSEFGLPNGVFNEHLAQLSQDLKDLDITPAEEDFVRVAYSLLKVSSSCYPDEKTREKALAIELQDLFPNGLWQTSVAGGTKPACWWLLAMIFELKNEIGATGDPLVQAVVDYCKIIHDPKCEAFRAKSCCPSILLTISGALFEVATVVFTDALYVQKVYTQHLIGGPDLDNQVLKFAKALKALQNAFRGLNDFYRILAVSPASPDGSQLFPRPTLLSDTEKEIQLRFLHRIRFTGGPYEFGTDEKSTKCCRGVYGALYEPPSGDEVKVIVKFAERYNVHAHQLLAGAGLAPKLYRHASLKGGHIMLVMEHVEGQMAAQLWLKNGRLPQSVYTDIDKAIQLLHREGIVHGDLRLQNIMVRKDADENEWHALVIDFEWAGRDGVVRYPASLTKLEVWAADVGAYRKITKAHDLHMLDQVKKCVV